MKAGPRGPAQPPGSLRGRPSCLSSTHSFPVAPRACRVLAPSPGSPSVAERQPRLHPIRNWMQTGQDPSDWEAGGALSQEEGQVAKSRRGEGGEEGQGQERTGEEAALCAHVARALTHRRLRRSHQDQEVRGLPSGGPLRSGLAVLVKPSRGDGGRGDRLSCWSSALVPLRFQSLLRPPPCPQGTCSAHTSSKAARRAPGHTLRAAGLGPRPAGAGVSWPQHGAIPQCQASLCSKFSARPQGL